VKGPLPDIVAAAAVVSSRLFPDSKSPMGETGSTSGAEVDETASTSGAGVDEMASAQGAEVPRRDFCRLVEESVVKPTIQMPTPNARL
jgi:hypothetical protein